MVKYPLTVNCGLETIWVAKRNVSSRCCTTRAMYAKGEITTMDLTHHTRDLDSNPFKPNAFVSPFEKYMYHVIDEGGRLRGGSDSMEKAISVAKTQSFFRPVRVIQKDSDETLAAFDEGVQL